MGSDGTKVKEIGFSGGNSTWGIGTAVEVQAFFDCLQAHVVSRYPLQEWHLLTDRLYKRYLRTDEVERTVELMRLVQQVFRYSYDRTSSGTTLAERFAKFFETFYDCVESAKYVCEEALKQGTDYQYALVRMCIADVPWSVHERERPLEEYDQLVDEPFWLTGKLPATSKRTHITVVTSDEPLAAEIASTMKGFTELNLATPEFVSTETGIYHLIANHCVENQEQLKLSISFNRARIEHAKYHLPRQLCKCVLVYDLRGQKLSDLVIPTLRREFADLFELKVLT
jgi:hypothetical protein